MKELVKHPEHYNQDGRKECWDEMIEKFGPEATAIFDVMSAYKYQYRAGTKDGNPEEQDKAKIENYMSHAANLIAITDSKIRMTAAKKVYKTMRGELDDRNN